ncbi:MAG: methyltransferase domain-containing protein [Patescibacteria group bacterium]
MKKYGIGHTLRKLYAGQSLCRILMNRALTHETIRGHVVDVGGGRSPDYFSYLQSESGTAVEVSDLSSSPIDFEKDPLPYASGSIDTVLLCNVLEHIYRYTHLIGETHRILRPDGRIIGFVPFWAGYHPDPHDYFRYTHEALFKMFAEAGFKDVTITRIGGGPFIANFNTVVLSFPRLVRPLLYIPYALLDRLFLFLRPASRVRFPLGYVFTASSTHASAR